MFKKKKFVSSLFRWCFFFSRVRLFGESEKKERLPQRHLHVVTVVVQQNYQQHVTTRSKKKKQHEELGADEWESDRNEEKKLCNWCEGREKKYMKKKHGKKKAVLNNKEVVSAWCCFDWEYIYFRLFFFLSNAANATYIFLWNQLNWLGWKSSSTLIKWITWLWNCFFCMFFLFHGESLKTISAYKNYIKIHSMLISCIIQTAFRMCCF